MSRARHLKVSLSAVENNILLLYEIVNGRDYSINHVSRSLPVIAYPSLQGRYKHLTPDQMREIQAETERRWADLKGKAAQRQ